MKNNITYSDFVTLRAFNSYFCCIIFLFVFVFGHSLYYIAFTFNICVYTYITSVKISIFVV